LTCAGIGSTGPPIKHSRGDQHIDDLRLTIWPARSQCKHWQARPKPLAPSLHVKCKALTTGLCSIAWRVCHCILSRSPRPLLVVSYSHPFSPLTPQIRLRSIRRLEAKLDRIAEASRLASQDLDWVSAGSDCCSKSTAASQNGLHFRSANFDNRSRATTGQALDHGSHDSRSAASPPSARLCGEPEPAVCEEASGAAAQGGTGFEQAMGIRPEVGQAARGTGARSLCEAELGEMMLQLDRMAAALGIKSSASVRDEQVTLSSRY
jgi:hypothetical protein